jgi:hypothetical protein
MRSLFSKILSLAILLAVPLSGALAASAYVHDLKGTLTVAAGAGPARSLKMGDTFDAGITLATGKDSIAVVKFEDGQVVTLAPETRFAVREYNYNKRSVKDSNMVFALLQGGLRFVTGVIGSTNNNAFKMNVGTATIGVRGTDGWASYVEGMILAAVNQGALAFTDPSSGTSLIPVASTLVVQASDPKNSVLTPTTQVAGAVRQSFGAQVANVIATATVVKNQTANVQIPINTPVVVQAAAQAAQVVATARAAQALAAAAANAVAAAKTDTERAAALAAQAAADKAAAQATALATAAIATAQAAAVQAFEAVRSQVVLPPAPPPTPAAAPLSAVVPTLTAAQIQAQTAALQSSVETQTTNLQTTQRTLGLPVTPASTIQNAAPVPPPGAGPRTEGQQTIQVVIPPPVSRH